MKDVICTCKNALQFENCDKKCGHSGEPDIIQNGSFMKVGDIVQCIDDCHENYCMHFRVVAIQEGINFGVECKALDWYTYDNYSFHFFPDQLRVSGVQFNIPPSRPSDADTHNMNA